MSSNNKAWDIKGKVCIVTGANCGLGRETTLELVRRGASRVIMACRNVQLGEEAKKYIRRECGIADELEADRRLVVRSLDLASFDSIRGFVSRVNAEESDIHLLVNNAGVYAPREKQLTADGFELSFGTNHLGHFLLTELLMDRLKRSAPSRVVVVASKAYVACFPWGFNIDDPNYETSWYQSWFAYGQSKLANILFARELDRKLNGDDASKPSGVTVYSLHPGVISTNLLRHRHWFLQLVMKPFRMFISTLQQGIATTIHCATEPNIEQHSGKYFENSAVSEPYAIAKDDVMATRLWEVSEKLVASKPAK